MTGGPRYARERDMSLKRAFQLWLSEPQPKFLLTHFLVWVGVRAYLVAQGEWGLRDLVPIVFILVAHPFVEWLIHVHILHHRPRKVMGFTWDYHAGRYHRLHHRDPWDLRFVLMPLPAMILGLSAAALVSWLVTPTPAIWATSMMMIAGTAAYYEWIHFLTHTSYRPRGRFFKRQWKLHRLHHYKNEKYWMGVTRHLGDMVLGTYPDPSEVESSKTARTLGLEDTLGESRETP
jgi:hypothetical protein